MARIYKGMHVSMCRSDMCIRVSVSGEREGGSWQQRDFFHTSHSLFLDWFSYLLSLKTLQVISLFASWLGRPRIVPGF